MSRLLSYRTVGSPSATKVGWILHGLLGNGRNWNSFATHLLHRLNGNGTDYRFFLLDLRHHGQSIRNSSLPAPDTIDSCVDDILYFSQETNIWPSTMIGHSFGGKVLMRLIQRQHDMERYVTKNNFPSEDSFVAAGNDSSTSRKGTNKNINVYVLDSMPGTQQDQFGTSTNSSRIPSSYPLYHHPPSSSSLSSNYSTTVTNFVDRHPKDAISKVLELIHSMPLPLPSRKIIRDTFINAGMPDKLATWMASNVIMEASSSSSSSSPVSVTDDTNTNTTLTNNNHTFRWAFNPEGVSHLYNSHMQTDTWNVLTNGPVPSMVHVHLLKANRSHRWIEPDTVEKLQYIEHNPKSNVHVYNVPGGHWLHVDNPKGVMDIICEQEKKRYETEDV